MGRAIGLTAERASAGFSPSRPMLSTVLFADADRRFGTLAPVPSNVNAIEAALLLSCGLHTFVAVAGPSGWGKSHLLQSAAYRLSQDHPRGIRVMSSDDWLASSSFVDPTLPLLLDNVQDTIARTRTRLKLRLALERRVRAGRPTLLAFTAPKMTRAIESFLPNSHDWIKAAITAPQPSERMVIVNQMSQSEGLTLSTALVRLLAYRMKGNGRTLIGALKRLRLSGSNWVDPFATLRACGLLNPFFADNSAWDLRETMLRAAEQVTVHYPEVDARELAIASMANDAMLAESEIAHFLGMGPAAVYQTANAFHHRRQTQARVSSCVHQYVETVVERLLID